MNRSVLFVSLATVLSIACIAAFESRQSALVFILLLGIPILCCGIIGALTYRASRFPWKGLLGGLILSLPILACIMATSYISTGRYDYTSRWDYENHIKQASLEIPRDQEDLAKYQSLAITAQAELHSSTGPYRIPMRLARGGFTHKSIVARETAAKLLATESAKAEDYYGDDILALTAYRNEAQRKLSTPFLSNVRQLIPISAIFSLFIFGTLAVCAVLGLAPASIRKAILTSESKVIA